MEFLPPDEEGRRKLVRLCDRGLEVSDEVATVIVRKTKDVKPHEKSRIAKSLGKVEACKAGLSRHDHKIKVPGKSTRRSQTRGRGGALGGSVAE
jgi:hypothetical protein